MPSRPVPAGILTCHCHHRLLKRNVGMSSIQAFGMHAPPKTCQHTGVKTLIDFEKKKKSRCNLRNHFPFTIGFQAFTVCIVWSIKSFDRQHIFLSEGRKYSQMRCWKKSVLTVKLKKNESAVFLLKDFFVPF